MVGVEGVVRGGEGGAGACAESGGGGVECDDGRTGCHLGGSWAHHLALLVKGWAVVVSRRMCRILVAGVRR